MLGSVYKASKHFKNKQNLFTLVMLGAFQSSSQTLQWMFYECTSYLVDILFRELLRIC